MRRVALPILVGACAALAAPLTAHAAVEGCTPSPDPARWNSAGTPDKGREPMEIAVHRGAAELAPENTMDAYRYAIAYGVERIEIDVQQLTDGRFVSFHDSTLDEKTDGSSSIGNKDYEYVRKVNAADIKKWKGSEYDPSRIPTLEEILTLARATDTRIYFDVKESVTSGVAAMANMAAEYGVMDRSLWRTFDPARDEAIKGAQPTADLMFSNYDRSIGPEAFFSASSRYRWFGSDLVDYSPEKVAAIHDGCSLAVLNTYSGEVKGSEAADTLHARAIGADAVQVNNPDVAVRALKRPVASRIEVRNQLRRYARGVVTACLVDAKHGFGLPEKRLRYWGGFAETGRNGCAKFSPSRRGGQVAFRDDGSALSSRAIFRSPLRPR